LSPLDWASFCAIFRLDKLIERANDGVVAEVVLATNFTNEGEATAHHISEMLKARLDGEPPQRQCRWAANSNTWTRGSSCAMLDWRATWMQPGALAGISALNGTLIAGPFCACMRSATRLT
jgi:hypothetical protein